MDDETPIATSTNMTDRTDEDDSIAPGSKSSQGHDTAACLEKDENTSTEFDMKKINECNLTMYQACLNKNWKWIENYLSNKSISNKEKRIVFRTEDSRCCRLALAYGAPCHIIKGMIDLMDPKSSHFLIFTESGSSWLHSALRTKTVMRFVRTSEDVIELLVSSGGKRLVNMQCKSDSERTSLQIYLEEEIEEGHCDKIINLLLEVGGLELLEIEDEDGYSPRDFSNESQRKIIIDYLKTLKECPRVQKHIEAFEDTDVTPKEFYDWIKDEEFDLVRSYLDSEEVSKEAKMKCINVQTGLFGRPFYLLCKNHGPIDIAEKMVDIVGNDFLLLKDTDGNNCLHKACDYISYDDEDDDYVPTDRDIEAHCEFIAFLLSRRGSKILLETNKEGDTALYNVMMCKLTNLECVKLVVQAGGDELLAFQDEDVCGWGIGGSTILHYASWRNQPDREVIKYLVSVGGPKLTEIKDDDGKKAEDSWSDELKEYIAFTTKTLPALSDDLQCPICFEKMFDVHIISQCCHRFCKSCITQSYEKRGNTCPVCRTEYSMRDVKKDPLLGKLAFSAKEEKDAKEVLQVQLSESQKEIDMLREQLQSALKRKCDEL